MSDPAEPASPSQEQPKEDPETIEQLRGERPRVVRLSRKAIGAASAGALALVSGAPIFALLPPTPESGEEAVNTQGVAIAEGLRSAPADYTQIPRLGPPLPGDLGKPILDARDRGAIAALPSEPAAPSAGADGAPDPERAKLERIAQEQDAARTSGLFLGGSAPSPVAQPTVAPPDAGRPEPLSDRGTEGSTDEHSLASPDILQAGSVIAAALITGIRSDQPGLVTAQVTENVYDSLTGMRVLVPQGSKLIGEYESDVDFGERRVFLVWNRLMMPGGRSVELDRQPAADLSGFAGLEDKVDYHWDGVATAALISTLLGIGSELGVRGDDELVQALRRGSQQSFNRAGEQIVARELNVRPTLTIRPGSRVRVLVTRDIDFGDRS